MLSWEALLINDERVLGDRWITVVYAILTSLCWQSLSLNGQGYDSRDILPLPRRSVSVMFSEWSLPGGDHVALHGWFILARRRTDYSAVLATYGRTRESHYS